MTCSSNDLTQVKSLTMHADKRHKYDYPVDLKDLSAASYVVQFVGHSKRVLDIGCGPGTITKILALKNQCKVTGLECDPEAIARVTPYCDTVIQADLNSPEWPCCLNRLDRFEVIVAADVLEHLYDPWHTLIQMAPLLTSAGYMVISLPHIGHASILSCLLSGNFEYRDWGLLDRTHIRFFCLKNIEDLFSQAALKIVDVKYVLKSPEETEFAGIWQGLAQEQKKVLISSNYANIYQIVVKAVPAHYYGEPVSLVSPCFRNGGLPGLKYLKMHLRKHLDSKTKERIRRFIGLLGIRL